MLKGALGSLGLVVAVLFQRLGAARDKFEELQAKTIEDAREGAISDREAADALKDNAAAMAALSAALSPRTTTMGPTPSGGSSAGGITIHEQPRS